MNQLLTKRSTITNLSLWIITLLLVVEAIGTSFYIPQFSELFIEFRAELPFLTKLVFIGAWAIWILPILALLLIVFNIKKLPIFFALILLFLGVLWIPIVVYGLYLPIFQLAEAEL